jgi:hypothetical protein
MPPQGHAGDEDDFLAGRIGRRVLRGLAALVGKVDSGSVEPAQRRDALIKAVMHDDLGDLP